MINIKLPMNSNQSDPVYTIMLQEYFVEIMNTVSKYEGLLLGITSDDRGVSHYLFIYLYKLFDVWKVFASAVFGLPQHRQDDAIRAVYTAVQLVKSFYNRNLTLYAGVSNYNFNSINYLILHR